MTDRQAEALAAELLERRERDQEGRRAIERNLSDEERREVIDRVGAVDRANTRRMQDIVSRYGWPKAAVIGKRAASAAFLLVQHADRAPAFQAYCLPLLEQAVAAGEASASGFAYLTDRVRVKQNRPQLYGTQYHAARGQDGDRIKTDGGEFTYLPPIVENPDELDARRKAAGLGPWIEYERTMARLQNREPHAAPRAWDGKLPVEAERR